LVLGRWGAPRVPRLCRPGREFLARARVLYHYPAERSSRRPSPRGAEGRTVRMQPQQPGRAVSAPQGPVRGWARAGRVRPGEPAG
jgi:hypothetical protein